MTVKQLAYDFFESDELRTLFLRAATTSTGVLRGRRAGLQGLVHVLALTLSLEPACGGDRRHPGHHRRLVAAGRRRGVVYHTHDAVAQVLVRDGRASGVRLTSGDTVAADVVVSAVGLPQTLLDLTPDVALSRRTRKPAGQTCTTTAASAVDHVACTSPGLRRVHRRPGDRAAAPAVLGPQGPRLAGHPLPGEIMTAGHSSRFFALSSTDTLWDPAGAAGPAPGGCGGVLRPLRFFDREAWQRIERDTEALLRESWAAVTPRT